MTQPAPVTAWSQVRALLPQGLPLPRSTWDARHAFVIWVLAAHVAGLPILGLANGWGAALALGGALVVATLTVLACIPSFGAAPRAGLAALGLAVSSALVILFSGGLLEARLHVVVVVALVALYQDWPALLLAVTFTLLSYAVAAAQAPHLLFGTTSAAAEPWKWTLVHGLAIVAEVGVLLAFWAGAEGARARSAIVLDAAGEAVFGLDDTGRITFTNPAAARLVGVSSEALNGRDVQALLAGVVDRLGDGTTEPTRGQLHRPDGTQVPVEWTLARTPTAAVHLDSVLVVRDITARVTLERQLEVRTAQQETLARLGSVALRQRDLDPVLDAVVQELARALEADFAAIEQFVPDSGALRLRAGVGWGIADPAPLPARAGHQSGFALANAGTVVVSDFASEHRFAPPPGLRGLDAASGLSVTIPGPGPAWGVLSVHSRARRAFTREEILFTEAVATLVATVVERHAIEEELRQHRLDLEGLVGRRTAELTQANRELEAFSYTVSHDLRAPLRTIDGFSRLLLQRHAAQLPEDARTMLTLLSDGALRMGRLIECVLSLSRVTRAPLAKQVLDLSAMAELSLRELAAGAPQRNVTWTVEPGLVAHGDAGLVRILLDNLLGNAWKFTGLREDASIAVRAKEVDGVPGVVVEDNGAGFDMAHANGLFQPFHRLHQPNQFEGDGIGLATVARIVRRHGGAIAAEGRVGGGARFTFTLEPPGPEAQRLARLKAAVAPPEMVQLREGPPAPTV